MALVSRHKGMRVPVTRVRLDANGIKFVWKRHESKRGRVYWRRTKYFFDSPGKYLRRRPA